MVAKLLSFALKKTRTPERLMNVAEHFLKKGTTAGKIKGQKIINRAIELFPENSTLVSKRASLEDFQKLATNISTESKITYPNLNLERGCSPIKKTAINLARNPMFNCDIPYNQEHFYRTIGNDGYKDFLETGIIRAKQNTKFNYQKIYFEKGYVNSIYTKKGGSEYIVESNSSKIKITQDGAYPSCESLNSKTDSFRIWHRLAQDKNGIPSYEIIFDSLTSKT